jgi:hypothetical protein
MNVRAVDTCAGGVWRRVRLTGRRALAATASPPTKVVCIIDHWNEES